MPDKSHRLPLAIISLILIASAYLRFNDLGDAQFHGDELDIVYAATSMETAGTPLLPSGNEYRRALDFSRVVQFFVDGTRPGEFGARVPAAVFGIISLVVMGAFGWTIGGPWAAVWSMLFLAIYPEHLDESRRVRFYSYQLTFVLVAMAIGWKVVQKPPGDGPSALRRWLAALASLVAFGMAFRVQVTTLSVMAGWGSAVAVLGLMDQVRPGRRAFRQNVALHLALLAVTMLVVVGIADPSAFTRMWATSQMVPRWTSPGDPRFYYWALSDDFPTILALAPVAVLVVGMKRLRFVLYSGLIFLIPLLLHSFLFPWKGERFIMSAMPGLFLIAGCAAAMGLSALRSHLQSFAVHDLSLGRRTASALSSLVVAAVAVFAVVTSNAFNEVRDVPPSYLPMDWTRAWESLEVLALPQSTPVGSSRPLEARFYWPRLDFTVGVDLLPDDPAAASSDSTVWTDYYAGVPILRKLEDVRRAFPEATQVVIVVDEGKIAGNDIDPELIEDLEQDGQEICGGGCQSLRVYLLPLSLEQ